MYKNKEMISCQSNWCLIKDSQTESNWRRNAWEKEEEPAMGLEPLVQFLPTLRRIEYINQVWGADLPDQYE